MTLGKLMAVLLIFSALSFGPAPASAVLVFGAEDDTPGSPAAILTARCEQILSDLEESSGIEITDAQVRARLIETIKQQPEMVLLQLMSLRAAAKEANPRQLDGIIKNILGRLNSEEESNREHNARMKDFYDKQKCSGGGGSGGVRI